MFGHCGRIRQNSCVKVAGFCFSIAVFRFKHEGKCISARSKICPNIDCLQWKLYVEEFLTVLKLNVKCRKDWRRVKRLKG